MKKLGASSALG